MPNGNAPAGGDGNTALPNPCSVLRQGAEDVLLRISSYGRGRASNAPKPPRTAVLPLWKGSQAKPMRGSKFFVVGLCDQNVFRRTVVGSPAGWLNPASCTLTTGQ